MAVTIEALLEENVGQMQSFLEHLRKLQEYFKSEVQTVDEKFESAEKSFAESIENMSSAKEVIGALDQALQTSEQEVESKLNELEGQYDEIAEKLETADKSANQMFTEMDAGAAKIESILNGRWESSRSELKAIGDAVDGLKERVAKRSDSFSLNISEECLNPLGTAVDNLEEQHGKIRNGFSTFTAHGNEVMEAAKQTMETELAEVEQELKAMQEAFSEKIESQIVQAASEEAAKVSEDINGPAARGLEKIHTAKLKVQSAKDAVEAEVSEVSTKTEQVVESMGEAESTLDSIKESL